MAAPLGNHDQPEVGRGVDLARYVQRVLFDRGHRHVAHPGQQLGEVALLGPYLPHADDHALTVVMGRAESASRSRRLAGTPAVTRCAPSAATIAPLSVHRPGRGTRTAIPCAAARSTASARSRELAATPPPMTRVSIPYSRHAPIAFAVSTSQTAS